MIHRYAAVAVVSLAVGAMLADLRRPAQAPTAHLAADELPDLTDAELARARWRLSLRLTQSMWPDPESVATIPTGDDPAAIVSELAAVQREIDRRATVKD